MIVGEMGNIFYVALDSKDYKRLFGIFEMVKAYIQRCSNM